MAEIRPFRGILYNQEKVNIAKVVTPPYDVISQKMQNRFYLAEKHNIVRLILGKDEKHGDATNNKYTRADSYLQKWIKKEILKKDSKLSLYVYIQQYLHKGRKRTRIGFISLMKIEDPKDSGVLPHEYTLDLPKKDRLHLIRRTKANLSPIFSLFQDKDNRINNLLKKNIKRNLPVLSLEAEGVIHKLWRVSDREVIKKVKKHMWHKKIFIADGHHRYEVALAYRNKMRKKKKFKRSIDYVMMYFTNLSERGNLTILSTHRVVKNIEQFDKKKTKAKLGQYFYIKRFRTIEEMYNSLEHRPRKEHAIGMYMGDGRFYLLQLKERLSLDRLINTTAKSLKKLDVTILHDAIINRLLRIKNSESSIKYIRNERDACSLVDKRVYQIAFLLKATDVMEMKSLAEKGKMMPQKSTYFYPKLLTGLVINKF